MAINMSTRRAYVTGTCDHCEWSIAADAYSEVVKKYHDHLAGRPHWDIGQRPTRNVLASAKRCRLSFPGKTPSVTPPTVASFQYC
jgi:hypothetical protein